MDTSVDLPGVGGEAAAPTSVLLCSDTVLRVCPRRPLTVFIWSGDDRRFVTSGCDAYICVVCGPRKVSRIVEAATHAAVSAGRSRLITLTLAPEDWQKRRQAVRTLGFELRKKYECEWLWTTEHNPRETGYHIHMLQHGQYIPQAKLKALWHAEVVDVRQVKRNPSAVAGYLTKEQAKVTSYLTKESKEDYLAWKSLNGDRPLHWSAGFFHGLDFRAYLQRARADRAEQEAGYWIALRRNETLPYLNERLKPGVLEALLHSGVCLPAESAGSLQNLRYVGAM